LLCPALILLLAPATTTAEPPSFPYKGYVTADGVYVRSGPGNTYYPTQRLDAGAEVEVHRHDPGGWYAIRPPEGSFTWVSGRYLKLEKDGLATVNGDRVAARVGSRFSDIRDVIQVRLQQGELVEVLEAKTIQGDPESATWYKIAPPAGEFRWIFGKYVDPEYPHDGVRKVRPGTSPLVQPVPAESEGSSGAVRIPTQALTEPQPSGDASSVQDPVEAQAKPSVTDREEPAASAPPASLPTETNFAQRFVEVRPGDPEPPAIRRMSPEEFQAELDDINLAMSIMLAEEPTVWNCDSLAIRAESLLAQAETALERGRARLLLNRIAYARDIKKRHDTLVAAKTETETDNRQLSELGRTRMAGLTRTRDQTSRFDGVGRLARVVPPTLGAPQYALKDDQGTVQYYVTPAPGVNMQYYVGRRIGITGIRGQLPELKTPHITAKHVTTLEQQSLR
jgi:hypothetical protein